jgi:hypothetical protein
MMKGMATKSPKGKKKGNDKDWDKPNHGKGRPLGSKNFKGAYEAISSLFAKEVQFPGGVKRFLTGTERIAMVKFAKALRGDVRCAEGIEDRLDGKPVQPIQYGDDMRPLRIQFDRGNLDPSPLTNEEGQERKADTEKPPEA